MNNSIGSFDNFSNFRNDSDSGEGDEYSSSGEELSEDAPSQTPDLKGPQVKKTILCEDEFIPMTKAPTVIDSAEKPLHNSSSDAPKTTKEKRKKTSVKENNSTPSNSKSKVKNPIPSKAKSKAKKGGRSPSQEKTLDSPAESSLLRPIKAKPTRVVKRSLTKKQKRRELSEDIKAQLKAVFNNLSKIYFSID